MDAGASQKSPGSTFLSLSNGEKLLLVLGYLTALENVTSTLESFRVMFLEGRKTGRLTDSDIGSLVPDYLTELVKLWNFDDVQHADVTAYAQAIYMRAENHEVNLGRVLEIARDLLLRRITDAEANEQLKKSS